MKLTARNKEMLLLLLKAENYVTLQFLAEQVNVSSRTVLRELNGIENWLNKKEITLEKKKGIGIRLNLNQKARGRLLDEIAGQKADLIYSPEQRLTLLKAELLKNSEITKLYTLTRLLEVTEATISSDLDKLVPWMNKYGLYIMKKPGLGVYVRGSEINIRSAIISLIYEQFHEAELINLIFNEEKDDLNIDLIKTKINQGILDIIDISFLELAKKLLRNVEGQMQCQFADNSYIALVIRISVTMHRCHKGMFIEKSEGELGQVSKDKFYELVKEWFLSNENSLTKTISEEEINHLVIHIKGAEIQERFGFGEELSLEDAKVLEMTKEVIYIAERETGIYLEDNEKLLRGLAGHLKMAIYRIKMHLDIMNPLLEDIKERYPDLFMAAAKCAEFIEKKERISIPEDEVAYLASHIGAAVKEEKNNILQIFRAAFVCTNDMGAAQLLVSEIEREFPNIKVSSIISLTDMDSIMQKHVDMIITTVELQVTKLPLILINPILNEGDKKKIREVLENFLPESFSLGRLKNVWLEEKLKRLKAYSDYILQLINNFLFIEQVVAKNQEGLYHFISHTMTNIKEERLSIEGALKNSEKKGAAILNQKGMVLYHCSLEEIKELSMIVLRLKDFVRNKDKDGSIIEAGTVIVLSKPKNGDICATEIVNEITRKIINTDFALSLKQQSKDEISTEINGILDYFIQNKVLETAVK